MTAVIEIGTHSVKCLRDDRDRMVVTRLGSPIAGADRTMRAVKRFLREGPAVIVGTHALRAGGKAVLRKWGLDVWVLTEDEEARFSHAGAVSDLGRGPFVTVDVGGGSTEIAAPSYRRSLKLGAATLTRRFFKRPVPSEAEFKRLRRYVTDRLNSVRWSRLRRRRFVGVGGTAVALALLRCGGERDPSSVHGSSIESTEPLHWADTLSRMSMKTRCALPGMDPERADILPAGLVVLSTAANFAGARTIVVTTRGVRHGVALSLEK